MKRVGDFWVPDVDLRRFSKWGKQRRKTLQYYGAGRGAKAEDLEEALALVGRGRVALDGGANVGAYTRIMLGHFETVLAFEPAPDTFAALARNIEQWGVSGRVRAYPLALSDKAERVRLEGKRGHRSVTRRIVGTGDIPAVRIDDLDLEGLDFIKLDLEGYELRALHGARETLSRFRPFVLFEDKPHKAGLYDTASDPHAFLESLGAKRIACVGENQFDWLYGFDTVRGTS